VLLVNWLQSGKAWQACAQQTEKNHSHTNSAVTRQIHVDALLVRHLYNSVFFQYMVWHGPTSETVWMQRRQKNWSKYSDFIELKKITSIIYSNSNYSSLFFKPFKFRCCSFCFIKEYVQLTVQVCWYFLLTSTFFKGKEKSGIFGGF